MYWTAWLNWLREISCNSTVMRFFLQKYARKCMTESRVLEFISPRFAKCHSPVFMRPLWVIFTSFHVLLRS